MTALIKSTDGGSWVEAKVGDEITCHIGRTKIASFDKDDEEWIVTTDGLYVEPAECQLIERPFRVGDDFEWIYHGMEYARNNVIDKPWHRCRVMSQIEADGMNEKENKHLYRHSSPLLRPVGGV